MSRLRTARRTVKSQLRATEHQVRRETEPLWRYVFNAGPTLAYRREPTRLGPEAQRVLAELNRDGASRSTLTALTGDTSLLGRLQETAAQLEAERAEELRGRRARLDAGDAGQAKEKVFVAELLDPKRPVIDPTGPLARAALHPALKGVADGYFGLRTRVADLNIWRTLPSSEPPRSSQLWHRDMPEDRFVLKMFVYLEDVDETAGPFSYALGTHAKGRRDLVAPGEHDGQTFRTRDCDLDTVLPHDRQVTFEGPAGTVLFADTIGYHKGGWATETPRLVVQALWASRAATDNRQLGRPAGLDRGAWSRDLAYSR